MKFILVFILLFFSCVVFAQTDSEAPQNTKPSWSSKLPDRNDAPEIDAVEEDGELSGLTMDRSALFGDDEDSSLNIEDSTEAIIQKNEEVTEQDRQAEADRIAEQDRQAEADRIVEQEKQAEADRIAEQEKQTEADRLADQEKLAEIDRRSKQEKIALDQKRAAEKRASEQVTNNATSSTETSNEIDSKPYTWKKIQHSSPEYPIKAARGGKEGWVDVEFTIDSSGKVIGAHPIKAYKNLKLFNIAALKAVRQWKFEPPSNFGIRINQTKTVRVVFNLNKK